MPPTSTTLGKIDGNEVHSFRLGSRRGIELDVLTYGAIIHRLIMPDQSGERRNVVLGYRTAQDYKSNPHYFGCVAGRFANRIGGGAFDLDGRRVELSPNDGDNTLHGGKSGFNSRHWSAEEASHPAGGESLLLRLHSPDGDQGFPGNLDASVQYTLAEENRVIIDYRATTDKPTVVNLTQHSYFNLDGEGFAILSEVPLVVFLTGKADRVWIPGNNEKIRALPAAYPNVTVIDWEVLGPQCPGDCFYDDEIHLNAAGRTYYADLIAKVLGL